MQGNNKFRSSMFGFNKHDVISYIDKLIADYDSNLNIKDQSNTELLKANKELNEKHNNIKEIENGLYEDKGKIAEALVSAKEQAKTILDEARLQALEEKRTLDRMVEAEKEKLVDIKSEIKRLKDDVVSTMKKYDVQMNELLNKAEKAEKDEKLFNDINN